MNPNVYIIGGPNGAGKTTLAKEFLPLYAKCKNFVNADLIAQGLAPFAPESVTIKAGRILLKELHNLGNQKVDFAFESTLSGKTYIPFIRGLKTRGYTVHIFLLWIPTIDLALARIRERVANGGHDIPAKDVRRRFEKVFSNFLNYYQPLADYWSIIDNSVIPPKPIARGESSRVEVYEQNLYKLIFKGKDAR